MKSKSTNTDNGAKSGATCSFCHASIEEVERLIAGPNKVFICNHCIETCHNSLNDIQNANRKNNASNILSEIQRFKPREIKNFLDQYIIGQDEAKRTLSVAIYNHYKRIYHNINDAKDPDNDEIEIQKSNVLLIGPTGCGKTLIIETLAKKLNVPFAIVDATTLTETGYVGEDVESSLTKLLDVAKNVDIAQLGIVYFDEIDKVAAKVLGTNGSRDISGKGVQEALLRMIQGAKVQVPVHGGKRTPHQETVAIDTTNILFIFGGSFDGLEKIILKRESGYGVGFESKLKLPDSKHSAEVLARVDVDDLIKYGFIPEFIGRIPIFTVLEELNEEALKAILVEPKNAIVKQYKKLLEMDNIELQITDDAIAAIAQKCMKKKTGARGLRSILESILIHTMFDISEKANVHAISLDQDVITLGKAPVILCNEKEIVKNKKETKSKKKTIVE